MPIDINTNLLAPRPVQSNVPKQDFSVVGQLPNIYRQGQLRQGLAKLAPDDFQGMARLLMQYGQPEQGVQAMQLATALKHQAFEEDLATKTYGLQSEEAKARLAAQRTELGLKLQDLQRPYANLLSAKPAYQTARDAFLNPNQGIRQRFTNTFGAPESIINNYVGSVADAMGLDKDARKDFINSFSVSGTDSRPTKIAKLNAVESKATSVGQFGERIGNGQWKASDFAISPYTGPATDQTQQPPTVPGPPTAYNQQPAVPATAPETTVAGPVSRSVPTQNIRMVPGTNITIPPNLANHPKLAFNPADRTFVDKITGDRFNMNGDPVGQGDKRGY